MLLLCLVAACSGRNTPSPGQGGSGGLAPAGSGGGSTGGTGGGGGSGGAPCTGWCQVPLPEGTPSLDLLAVSAYPGGVFVAGRRGIALRGDASGLAATDARTQLDLTGIWAAGPDDAWAVGARGGVRHWDGKLWTGLVAGTEANLYAVHGTGSDDVWIAGDDGAVAHWDGKVLTPLTHDCGPVSFGSIRAGARDDVFIGSSSGIHLHWDGRALTCTPDGLTILDLAGIPGDPVWVLSGQFGGGGTFAAEVYHGDLENRVSGFATNQRYAAIWAGANDDVWLFGEDGIVARGDDRAWHPQPPIPGSPGIRDCDGLPGGMPWIVGDAGYVAYFAGP